MAQKKAHEVDSWLTRPASEAVIVLIYGPDRGLVSERAAAFATKTGLPLDDPFSVVKLDAGDIERDSGRLVDEARTVPMFAARRLIWVRNAAAQKSLADDVKALAADPPRDAIILIEAQDLKKGSPLRSTVEAAFSGMALPCYADEARDLESIIDDELRAANLTMAMDARNALRRSLGGDRLATRGEIQKLTLYAMGGGEISLEDVKAMIGDVSALSLDDAIDAAMGGNIAEFDTAFTKQCQNGSQAAQLLAAATRHLHNLHLMRGDMESGNRNASAVIASARPPVFFSRKRAVERALSGWSADALMRALARLQSTTLQTRRRPDLAVALARQALLGIAVEGARVNARR
ncbi:DNA polymerase III subunit delta [Aminobacter sp. HY435]|uniref:DNA polymerase III subunit delta n=1 Tax=Aminobacter sp. HY435 TaxID=2970917 RepID=UPI0022B9B177|nr:DNA polymerase III subunit delta [Aminobacter sp. HY435]